MIKTHCENLVIKNYLALKRIKIFINNFHNSARHLPKSRIPWIIKRPLTLLWLLWQSIHFLEFWLSIFNFIMLYPTFIHQSCIKIHMTISILAQSKHEYTFPLCLKSHFSNMCFYLINSWICSFIYWSYPPC